MSDVRQRNVQKPDEGPVPAEVPAKVPTSTPNLAKSAKAEDEAFNLLDVARTCVFLLLTLSALSFIITKDNFTFGLERPEWTRPEVLTAWLVCSLPYHHNTH